MAYLNAQMDEIKKHRWIESEKAGEDLGQSAILDWVNKYLDSFNRKWNCPA